MNKDASGAAFPSTHHNGWGEPEKGMTLRDYFAAAYLSNKWSTGNNDDITAKQAYAVADAMMKAREQ